MESYSVRCIFLWAPRPGSVTSHVYEERITLWHATDIDEAISLAEAEAEEYASDGERFLGFSQAYRLPEPLSVSGCEVFSLLRGSELSPQEYISHFFSTGSEHEGA
jgi:hypothetical protein